MSIRRRTAAALISVGLLVTGPAAAPGTAVAGPTVSPLRLHAPGRETVYSYRGHVYFDTGAQLIAVGNSFEIWSHRKNFRSPITSEWHEGATVTQLPAGLMTNFSGLNRFLDVRILDAQGNTVVHRHPTICLNGWQTYRVVPDGAPHSTYPYDCPRNIFARGSVQGIAAGWATQIQLFGYRSIKLAVGTYTMRLAISSVYRKLFGITSADASRTVRVTVRKQPTSGGGGGTPITIPGRVTQRSTPRHTGPRLAALPPDTPEPDLAALPAWGVSLSPKGRYLNFAATVWNAGDSPLVVDGFREKGEPTMDAYQYFYDSQGNQIGYVPAGKMEWDPRPTHQHWHFENFARYRLLDADKTKVQRSHKEAFCLANTDAIDYTVPGAQWRPDNTDLATACGDSSAIAVSEYLASGSGDTYEQFRAGQSFDLTNVPNGIYYISVEANPANVLTEQTSSNNVALRKLRLGGTAAHRTLHVYPIGDITG